MEASENRVGLTIVRAIHRYGGVRPQISSAAATRASLERTTSEHRAIYDALRARDPELAGELTAASHRVCVGRTEGFEDVSLTSVIILMMIANDWIATVDVDLVNLPAVSPPFARGDRVPRVAASARSRPYSRSSEGVISG